jgi:hypothetical protein
VLTRPTPRTPLERLASPRDCLRAGGGQTAPMSLTATPKRGDSLPTYHEGVAGYCATHRAAHRGSQSADTFAETAHHETAGSYGAAPPLGAGSTTYRHPRYHRTPPHQPSRTGTLFVALAVLG